MRAFLSHSSADKPLATKIFRALRDQAVAVWFDRMELRPGDSLITRIADGITNSEYLLVLVTDNSKRSPWVQKELSIALTKEINGDGPTVSPLLLQGCDVPTCVADKLYVTIDSEANGIEEVIPAIFRDSYILDISLRPDTLQCDSVALREHLYEFIRQDCTSVKVRIHNRNFNRRVTEITTQAADLPGVPEGARAQIKRVSESFHLELPIYWVNLADLLARFIDELFGHYGRNLDGVKESTTACIRALDFAQYEMCSRVGSAVFAIHATQFGHPDIASYVTRFSSIERHEVEKLVRTICEFRYDQNLAYVGMYGNRSRKIVDQTVRLPFETDTDKMMPQMTCSGDEQLPQF